MYNHDTTQFASDQSFKKVSMSGISVDFIDLEKFEIFEHKNYDGCGIKFQNILLYKSKALFLSFKLSYD